MEKLDIGQYVIELSTMPRSLNSSLMKPLVVLALPGMYLAYKITEYKRQQQEQKRRKVTEKELTNLNHKIDKLLTRLEEHEPELASSQDEECVICISAKATMQTYPCGHRVVCRKCFVKTIQMTVSQRLLPLRCVICRTKILRLKQSGPGKNCPAPTPIPPGSLASLPVAALRQAASANGGGSSPSLGLGAHAKCVLHKHDNQRRRSSSSDATNQLALAAVTAAHLKAPPERESPEARSPNDPSSSKSRPRVAPFPGKQPSMLFTIPEKEEADTYDPLSLARAIRLRAENGCAAVIESSSVAGAAVASTSVSSDFRWPRSSDPWRASPSKLQSEPGTSSSNRPSSSNSVSSSSSMSSSAEERRRITRAEVHANPDLWRDSPPRRAKDRGKRPETPARKKSSEIRRVPEIVSDEASPEKTLLPPRGRSSPPSSSSPSPSTLSSRAYSSPTASFTGQERRSRLSPDFGQGLVVTAAEVHIEPGDVVSPLDHFPQMVGKNGRGFTPQILTPVKADAHHPWAESPVSSGARIKSASKSSLVETREVDEPLSLFDPLKETSRPPTPGSGTTTPSSRAKLFANADASLESPEPKKLPFAHLEPPPPRKPSKSPDLNPRVFLSSESRVESEEQPIQALPPPKSTKTSTSTTSTGIQTTPVNPSPPFAPSFFKEAEGGIERNPFKDAPRAVEPVAKKSLPSAAIELLAKPSLWKENPSRSRLKMGKSGSGLLGSKKPGSRSFAPEVQPLVAKMRSAKISPAKIEARLQPTMATDGWSESPTRNGGSTRSALVDAMDPWRGSPSRTKVFPATFEITEMWGESLSKPLLSPHNSPRKQTKMSARAKMAQLSPLASLQQLRNRSPLKVLRLKHS